MKKRLLIWMCLALCLLPVTLHAQTPSKDDAAIRSVVEAQLQAFAEDKDTEAYGYAAPIVRGAFPTVELFMTMVKRGYRPVYRNSQRRVLAVEPNAQGRPTVRVRLIAEDGKNWEAIYTMEQQPDGAWKIAGCALVMTPGTDV